jgi:hypothetical protein
VDEGREEEEEDLAFIRYYDVTGYDERCKSPTLRWSSKPGTRGLPYYAVVPVDNILGPLYIVPRQETWGEEQSSTDFYVDVYMR